MKKAADYFRRGAELGDTENQYSYAYLLERGEGLPKNGKQACQLYEQTAGKGHIQGQVQTAFCYLNGTGGTPKDPKRAVAFFEQAARQNDAGGQYWLARSYEYGKGIDKDLKKANEWYARSAENGYIPAIYRQGRFYIGTDTPDKNVPLGIKYLLQAAAKNMPEAYYDLGKMYYFGKLVKADLPKAAGYFRSGMQLGHADSRNFYASMLENGDGVPQNEKEAFTLYEKSAREGNAYAQYKMGRAYVYGANGIDKNPAKGIVLLENSAKQNEVRAMAELGNLYWYGNGITPDPEKAIDWLTKAGRKNNVKAQTMLGYIYAFADRKKGISSDYQKAFYWFEKATEQGDPAGKAGLGGLYFFGNGIPKNEKEGIRLLTEVAGQNHAFAMEILGNFYMEKNDKKEAEKWYRRAAATGDKTVIESMKKKGVYPVKP